MFSTRRALQYALGIWTVNIFLTAMEWAKIDKAMRGIHLTLWYLCLLASTATQIGVLKANIQPLQLDRDAGFSKPCSNPFICFWKNIEILQRVKDLLKKIVS